MFLLSKDRYLDFRLVNGGTPVTGVTMTNLSVFFTRNAQVCADPLTLVEVGSGRYFIKYTPTAEGHDYVEVEYVPTNSVFTFPEDIVSGASILGSVDVVLVTDTYLIDDSLQVTQVSDPQNWTLYVYNSADWWYGSTQIYNAVASTTLNSSGRWIMSPLTLSSGTYHFVVRNKAGLVNVIRANVDISV